MLLQQLRPPLDRQRNGGRQWVCKSQIYWEIGGAGGPAGATGGNGGVEAVMAGAGTGGGAGTGDDSDVPLETAADIDGGAGVTGGTGSDRSAGVSPLSLGASTLAD